MPSIAWPRRWRPPAGRASWSSSAASCAQGATGVPVVDARGGLVGILTQRDCLDVGLQGVYHQEPAGRVADYMSHPVDTLDAGASLAEVVDAFRRSRHRRFPVLDDGRLVGQISRRDVLRATLDLW